MYAKRGDAGHIQRVLAGYNPAFEPGRPGESAIELGRVIDRGLRESRTVDMESLCVVAGKHVWSIASSRTYSKDYFERGRSTLGMGQGKKAAQEPHAAATQLLYTGRELPVNVKKGLFKYLEQRWITLSATNYIHDYMVTKLVAP